MIKLRRLNNSTFFLNHHHIEAMEASPDTIITLTNERKYIVRESLEEIIERIQDYESEIVLRSRKFSA